MLKPLCRRHKKLSERGSVVSRDVYVSRNSCETRRCNCPTHEMPHSFSDFFIYFVSNRLYYNKNSTVWLLRSEPYKAFRPIRRCHVKFTINAMWIYLSIYVRCLCRIAIYGTKCLKMLVHLNPACRIKRSSIRYHNTILDFFIYGLFGTDHESDHGNYQYDTGIFIGPEAFGRCF